MSVRFARVIVACLVAGGLTAACGISTGGPGAAHPSLPTPTVRPSCQVGISWFNQEDDYIPEWEEPALTRAIVRGGAGFLEKNANSAVEGQGRDIDALVAEGARVIVIEPGIESDYMPAVQRAIDAGIPVIATFRAIPDARTLYVAYDPTEEGRQEARALLAVKPRGNYVIVKDHDVSSPESDLIAAGALEILQPAVARGDIKILTTVEWNWASDSDQWGELTAILSQKRGKVDAVAVESESLAGPVQQMLAEAGLKGKVAVGGISRGEQVLLGILNGSEMVDVWGNPERLGTETARIAIALCHDPDISRLAGSALLAWPGHDSLTAFLLTPVPITKDNSGEVVNASAHWRQYICQGDYIALVPACQQPVPSPTTD